MEGILAQRHICGRFAEVMTRPLAIILLAGLAVRLVLIPLFSFDYDLSFWVATGQGLEGGRDIYEASYYWYTPVWGYILSITTGFGNLLGLSIPGEMFGELVSSVSEVTAINTTITTISANVLYKTPLLIIDVITAWVLYGIVKHMTNDVRKATAAFGLWFLCPLVIWSSSVACMFDSLSALFTLMGFFFLIKGNYMLSGSAFILAVSTKVFPMCLILVILAYIISKHKDSIRDVAVNAGRFLLSGAAMFFVIYLPVLLTGGLSKSFEFLYSRAESVSGSSLDPVNVFMNISYNQIIQLAPILIIALILIGIWMYRSDPEERDRNLIMAIVMSFTVMFIWPPTPTYPVVLIPFLALAIMVCGRKRMVWSWMLFSVIMTMGAFFIFHVQLLYSLAAYTDILNLNVLISAVSEHREAFHLMEVVFRYLEFIPGISVLLILYAERRSKKSRKMTEEAAYG